MNYQLYISSIDYLYYIGIALIIISALLFEFIKQKQIPVFILFAAVLFINIFFINADPFLHIWDEQYHALVAKNLSKDFLYPYLISIEHLPESMNPIWVNSHVWLHKHPAFLWFMALSIKTFGVSYWSIRLPSAILTSLMIFAINSIGRRVVNIRVGFWAAVFFSASQIFVPLVSGRLNTDHNDAMFAAFVVFSFLYVFKYIEKRSILNLMFLVLFIALAVLTKWLVGFIALAGWGIFIITNPRYRYDIRAWLDIIKVFVLVLVLVLPWHIYAFYNFTDSYIHEYNLMNMHFSNIIEDHSGGFNYYILALNKYIKSGFATISILSLLVFISPLVKVKNGFKIIIVTNIITMFLFFSFSATKMPMFTYPVIPLVFIIVAALLDCLFSFIKLNNNTILRKTIFTIAFIIFGVYLFNPNHYSQQKPVWKGDEWQRNYIENNMYKNIAEKIEHKENAIIFNLPDFKNVEFTFETGIDARTRLPNKEVLEYLELKGIDIYIINLDSLPKHIINNKYVNIIESTLWKNGKMNAEIKIYSH